MEFASDVTEGNFLLNMIGNHQLWLENYQSILLYTDQRIEIMAKKVRICIAGEHLNIEYYGAVEMKVSGLIQEVYFK